ncbi:MAG: hypothetical protein ACREIV_11555, partial [Planctomycetaceae bacterium]
LARRTFVSLLALCGVYAAVVLVSKLLGILPFELELWHLAVLPPAALLLGLALHRRPSAVEAARYVDQRTGQKDLFLTVAMLDGSPGEFKPLVAHSAEARAVRIRPATVVPFTGAKQLGIATLALLILLGGMSLPVQFDPFGQVEAAEQAEEARRNLDKQKKATERRLAQLRRDQPNSERSKEVEQAINNLKNDFNKMKPNQKQENLRRLQANQGVIGQKWRKLTEQELRELFSQRSMSQQFGGLSNDKLQKWLKDLQTG